LLLAGHRFLWMSMRENLVKTLQEEEHVNHVLSLWRQNWIYENNQ